MFDIPLIIAIVCFSFVFANMIAGDYQPEFDQEQLTFWPEDCFCGHVKARHNRGLFKKKAKGCRICECTQYSKKSEGKDSWKKKQKFHKVATKEDETQ